MLTCADVCSVSPNEMLHRLLFEYGEAMRILHEQFVKIEKMKLQDFLGCIYIYVYIREYVYICTYVCQGRTWTTPSLERLERMLTYADIC